MSIKNKIATLSIFFFSYYAIGQSLKPVKHWEGLFLKNWKKEYKVAAPLSISKDSWDHYKLAYYIDANTSMFQACENVKYLDRALEYVNNLIDSAVPSKDLKNSQFKDNYLGWANHSAPSLGNDGKEYPLIESYCWRYIATLLRQMNDSGIVKNDTKYKKEYDKILNFMKINIFEKWQTRGKNNIYRSNVHMFSHWAKISLNLWKLTNDKKYLKVVEDFYYDYKNHLSYGITKKDNYIHWESQWKGGKKIQDVSHGNAVIGLIIEAYELNCFFSKKDIDKLVGLFSNIIWPSRNLYSEYIDGTGEGNGWFSDGFVKLGRFDEKLQNRLEKHNKGRGTQLYGNMALNSLILSLKSN